MTFFYCFLSAMGGATVGVMVMACVAAGAAADRKEPGRSNRGF